MSTILALETSSEVASVALLHGDQLSSRETRGVQSHSQAVLPLAQALLAEAGLRLSDCDAIAFGAGPGSFTGVRTACGIAQGLAFGAGLPVVPVVTLLAMAQACRDASGATEVLAILDARMNEVYWAQYRYHGGYQGGWQEVRKPTLSAASEVSPEGRPLAVGNGVPLCGELDLPILDQPQLALPQAAAVARLARVRVAAGDMLDAALAQPLYLRNKVALTTAEREARARA